MDDYSWNDAYLEAPERATVPDHVIAAETAGLPPGRALDLGCGSGAIALSLASRGWSVVGVDIADEAVRLANEAAAEQGLDATFEVGDLGSWQASEPFDLVVTTFALPGGDVTRAALRAASAALADGGTLLVVEWDRSMAAVWTCFQPEDLLTPEEVVALLPDLAIEVAEVRRVQDVFPDPEDPRHTPDGAAAVLVVRASRPD